MDDLPTMLLVHFPRRLLWYGIWSRLRLSHSRSRLLARAGNSRTFDVSFLVFPFSEKRLQLLIQLYSAGSFPLGFGLGPLFTAPLSEAYGRYPLYLVSALFYLIFFIPIAVAQNIETVIICRFIQGIAASTGSTLVGGTVSDLFDSQ
jgi:MFS family permease